MISPRVRVRPTVVGGGAIFPRGYFEKERNLAIEETCHILREKFARRDMCSARSNRVNLIYRGKEDRARDRARIRICHRPRDDDVPVVGTAEEILFAIGERDEGVSPARAKMGTWTVGQFCVVEKRRERHCPLSSSGSSSRGGARRCERSVQRRSRVGERARQRESSAGGGGGGGGFASHPILVTPSYLTAQDDVSIELRLCFWVDRLHRHFGGRESREEGGGLSSPIPTRSR